MSNRHYSLRHTNTAANLLRLLVYLHKPVEQVSAANMIDPVGQAAAGCIPVEEVTSVVGSPEVVDVVDCRFVVEVTSVADILGTVQLASAAAADNH